MASAGESGALAACLGNSSLMVFQSTVLIQIGAPAIRCKASACSATTSLVYIRNTPPHYCMECITKQVQASILCRWHPCLELRKVR